jgi:hypothetical protein
MLSEKFLDFIRDSDSDVATAIYMAHIKDQLATDKAVEVDVNDKYELVYRQPGKLKRQILRPGKLPALVLPDHSFADHVLEAFVNEFKAHFCDKDEYRIEIVSGEDIPRSYETVRYGGDEEDEDEDEDDRKNPLWASCMNDDGELLDLYAHNPQVCRLARMIETDTGLIVARALLWHTEQDITLMDRVYYTQPDIRERMLKWAASQGYHRKTKQSYEAKRRITTPKGEEETMELSVLLESIPSSFPYVDTFSYLFPDQKRLTNTKPSETLWWYLLTNTDGSFGENKPAVYVYSSYYDREIDQASAVYSEIVGSWIELGNGVTIADGIYPRDHEAICYAYSLRRIRQYNDQEYLLRAGCLQTYDGTWFEKGFPWFLYHHGRSEWMFKSGLSTFDLVTNAYGEQGLWNGSYDKGQLLPADTEILHDILFERPFARGNSQYGYFFLADRMPQAVGWVYKGYGRSSDYLEVPEGTTLDEARALFAQHQEARRIEAAAASKQEAYDRYNTRSQEAPARLYDPLTGDSIVIGDYARSVASTVMMDIWVDSVGEGSSASTPVRGGRDVGRQSGMDFTQTYSDPRPATSQATEPTRIDRIIQQWKNTYRTRSGYLRYPTQLPLEIPERESCWPSNIHTDIRPNEIYSERRRSEWMNNSNPDWTSWAMRIWRDDMIGRNHQRNREIFAPATDPYEIETVLGVAQQNETEDAPF